MFPNDQTKLEDSTTPHSADTTPAGERLRPFLFQLVEHVGPTYAARPEDFYLNCVLFVARVLCLSLFYRLRNGSWEVNRHANRPYFPASL